MMMMKREREVDTISMANYLMMLSRGSEFDHQSKYLMMMNSSNNNNNNRVFECKTCNRQFSSFQALGGHRASHKKPRLMEGSGSESEQLLHGSPPKPKTHECSICGLEFAIGQALGGHMRRHRSAASNNGNMHSSTMTTTIMSSSSGSVDNSSANEKKEKANNNSKRSVLFLDLNLTPFENDLEILKIEQPTPLVDCFN